MNEHDYIVSAILRAYQEVLKNDFTLLLFDVNERSITHRLAIYLEKYFPEYHVDCEYNRDGIGRDPKQLLDLKNKISEVVGNTVTTDDENATTVYPDIIIHRRGIPEGFVVIEAKKSSNFTGTDFDRIKLKEFKRQLGYKYAFSVVFPVITHPDENFPKPNYQELIQEVTEN